MKKFIFLSFFILLGFNASGQQLSPILISPGGGITPTGGFHLEWAIGELAVETLHFSEGFLSEGFLQPFLTAPSVEEAQIIIPVAEPDAYRIIVYPNPVQSQLHVFFESQKTEKLDVSLYDQFGRMLTSYPEVLPFKDLRIDLNRWQDGLYVLLFRSGEGKLIRQYRIIKIH